MSLSDAALLAAEQEAARNEERQKRLADYRKQREERRKQTEAMERIELRAAQRAAAKRKAISMGARADEAADEIAAKREELAKQFREAPKDISEDEIVKQLDRWIEKHLDVEKQVASSIDAQEAAYKRAAAASKDFVDQLRQLEDAEDAVRAAQAKGGTFGPATARGVREQARARVSSAWQELKAAETIVEAEERRQDALKKQAKPLGELRKRAEKLKEEIEDARDEAEKKIKLKIEIENIDAKIAQLRAKAKGALFINVTDPRTERAAFAEREKNAKRIADETLQDARRETMLRNRLAQGRHVTKKNLDWLAQVEAFRGAQAVADKAGQDIRAMEAKRDKMQAQSVGYLKDIRDKLTTLLQAA